MTESESKKSGDTTVVLRGPKYDKDYTNEFVVQWADSKYSVINQAGETVEAGTMLIIRDRIEFLSQLSSEQLTELIQQVKQAVNHELLKRTLQSIDAEEPAQPQDPSEE